MKNETNARTRAERYDQCILGRFLPRYALFSAPCCFLIDSVVYFLTKLVQPLTGLPFHQLVLWPDTAIPFLPSFMLFYVGTFVFWVLMFIAITHRGREEWFRFFTANAIGLLVCGVFFVLLPTKIDRPEVTGSGFFEWLCRFIYAADTPAVNLFPSIHCYGSWICAIGVRGQKRYPKWVRVFAPLFALLVCFTTVAVRQHFFVDTVAGVLLAELVWFLVGKKPAMAKPAERFFDSLDKKVFGTV